MIIKRLPYNPLYFDISDLKNYHIFPVGPSAVRIKYDKKPLSVGKSYKIQCEAIGSKPMASITWWINQKQVSQQYNKSKPM